MTTSILQKVNILFSNSEIEKQKSPKSHLPDGFIFGKSAFEKCGTAKECLIFFS